MEDEFYDLSSFAVEDISMEGMSLLDTVNKVKPNILIGWLNVHFSSFNNINIQDSLLVEGYLQKKFSKL